VIKCEDFYNPEYALELSSYAPIYVSLSTTGAQSLTHRSTPSLYGFPYAFFKEPENI